MKQLLFIALIVFVFSYERFDNHHVIKLYISSEEHLSAIEKLESVGKIDIWSENATGGSMDIRIPAEHIKEFKEAIVKKFSLKYDIIHENLQQVIDQEQETMSKRVIFDENAKNADQFFTNFRNLQEINNWVQLQARTHPNLCSIVSAGKSYENREILGLKIHAKNHTSKGSILFHGGIHAREWIAPTTTNYIAHKLLTTYNTDPLVKRLVDNLEFHVFPVLNPDGFHFTHTSNRMWRKTRKPNPNSSCIGTDPNRNWGYKWNTGGSSDSPCSDAFHGSAPFSEIEVRSMANYGKSLLPNLKGYIDFHAYGQLYMRPWGWSKDAPKDEARLKLIGDQTAAAISAYRGKRYQSGRISIIIYIASGSSADYFYGEHGVNGFGVELGTGFAMPVSEIVPVGEENFAGMKVFAQRFL